MGNTAQRVQSFVLQPHSLFLMTLMNSWVRCKHLGELSPILSPRTHAFEVKTKVEMILKGFAVRLNLEPSSQPIRCDLTKPISRHLALGNI